MIKVVLALAILSAAVVCTLLLDGFYPRVHGAVVSMVLLAVLVREVIRAHQA